MKRSLILSLIVLIVGLLPISGANVTNSTENLVFGKMWMEGNCRAKLVQRLHVEVTNKGSEDYQGFWQAIDYPKPYVGISYEINIAAGKTEDATIEIFFSESGHYDVLISTMGDGKEMELFTFPVDIADYQAPRIKGEIRLDMLEKTDDGNILYGDLAQFRISGTATITNEDDYTIIGWGNIMDGGGSGLDCTCYPSHYPWKDFDQSIYMRRSSLGHEIKKGETITKNFVIELPALPKEDVDFEIKIDVMGYTVASIPFKVAQCTNTYWTADRHVKPLPMGANQVLEIPAEALAVDMRGQYEINTIFSVDVSRANPNCLYYLGYLDNVPQGFTSAQNVIRDYEAKTLVVDADYDYYCPMPFKAKTAFFNYTPVSEAMGQPQPFMSQKMSGTFILPFDATQAWLTAVNDAPGVDADFDGDALRILRFVKDVEITADGNESVFIMGFEPVTEKRLNAYEPYLMYVLPSPVRFFAEDTTVPQTRPAVKKGHYYNFIGHTTQINMPNGGYRWHSDNYYFYLSDSLDPVRPFSAMMYIADNIVQSSSINDILLIDINPGGGGGWQINGIKGPSVTGTVPVYSLSGQRIGTAEKSEDRLTVGGLKPGIYIIGGKKVVIK